EGGKRLRNILLSRGLITTIATCKEAIRQVVAERRTQSPQEVIQKEPARVLIYDIETSYNIVKSWRVGYKLNINPEDILHERAIICISYKWKGEDQVYNLKWDDNQ